MESQKSLQEFVACSGEQAWDIGRRLIEIESRGHGDVESALHRLQAKTGIDYWQWWAFRYRPPPERVLADTWRRLVSAYRVECERKAREFCSELLYAASLSGGALSGGRDPEARSRKR